MVEFEGAGVGVLAVLVVALVAFGYLFDASVAYLFAFFALVALVALIVLGEKGSGSIGF